MSNTVAEDYTDVNQARYEADKKDCEIWNARFEVLETERRVTEENWQDCYDHVLPRKGDVVSNRPAGDKRGQELYDVTAVNANGILCAALHGMLTNPTVRFFEFEDGDPEFDNDEEVIKYFQTCGDRIFAIINDSNFQTEIHEIYLDETSIGTACLYIGEHEQNVVHFNARAMKEIYIDEDNLGRIDTVFRKFKWKPRQIVQEFGLDGLHPWIQQKYREGKEEPVEIIHLTEPMTPDEIKGNGKSQAFKSVYWLREQKIVLSLDGFREFPYAVPRWTKTSGEKYGRSPTMDMLPETKMQNSMRKTTIEGAQITVRPPMTVVDDGVIGKVRLTPGGLTVTRKSMSGQSVITPLITDARIDFGFQALEESRKQIRSGYMIDRLQMQDGPQKTAEEVAQIRDENLRLMGPVLGRQKFELIDPMLMRVFKISERRGKLPTRPAKLLGRPINVKVSSLIARAQRMADGQNMGRAITTAAPIINAVPAALDVINADRSVKHILKAFGFPGEGYSTAKEIKDTRDARAKAQAQAAQDRQQQLQAEMAGKVLPGAAQMAQVQQGGQ